MARAAVRWASCCERCVAQHIRDPVGAEEGDVAVAQLGLKAVRLDRWREADGALEDMGERAVIHDVIVRELRELATAGKIDT